MSRSQFDFFFRTIRATNLISLVLSDDDQTPGQISLFLSAINMSELQRLRSLSLLQIDERQLFLLLTNASLQKLQSLTILWRRAARWRSHTAQILTSLSSIISEGNLRHLSLNLWIHQPKNISWPSHCKLRYLRLDTCLFSEYCLILDHLSHLKTFVLNHCSMYDVDPIFSSLSFIRPSYLHLRSLSLNNVQYLKLTTILSFLSVTPSLEYLKLIASGSVADQIYDASLWKDFIQEHLHFLHTFEFCFTTQRDTNHHASDVIVLSIPFSNRFWTKEKRWFVKCDLIISNSQIRLYSLPICQASFEYVPQSNLFSRSTLICMNEVDERINHVHTMNVNLSTDLTEEKFDSRSCYWTLPHALRSPDFQQVAELELRLDGPWPIDTLSFLSKAVNLFHLVQINLRIRFDDRSAQNTTNALKLLLKQTPNVHTLRNHSLTATAEMICTIVPQHLRCLQMKTDRLNDMKMILQRLEHLLSVRFQFPIRFPTYSTNIIKWLKRRETSFTFWCTSYCLHLWFDDKMSR